MTEIHSRYRNVAFRFIEIPSGSKKPIGKEWQKRGKRFDDPELLKHLEAGGNYGIMGGHGNYAGVDADAWEVQQVIEKFLLKTTKVRSGGVSEDKEHPDKFHYGFIVSDGLEKTIPLHNPNNKNENWGHIRWFGGQLVGANSIHENGRTYEAVQDVPIATITRAELLSALSPFIKKNTPTAQPREFESLRVEDVVSTAGLTTRGNGKYQGAHPFHPSTTKWDFELDTNKNVYFCFNHNTGGGAFELIAMEAGILDCGDCGTGCLADKEKFKQVLAIAREKYGLKEESRAALPANELVLKDFNYFAGIKKNNNYIIENFIYPGTLNALWSPPGHFKSLLGMYAGMQIATGKPFLNLKTKKCPVVIGDNENSEKIIRDRLFALRRGHKIRRRTFPLYYLTNSGALFDYKQRVEQLLQLIQQNEIKLVEFDTLHRFGDYEEDRADAINKLYRNVLKPITELDCAVLYLHHTGKSGNYRGSIDLLGCVDTAYKVMRKGRSNKFELQCEKSRFGEIDKIYGMIDFGEDFIKIMRLDEDEEEKESKTKFMEVVTKIGELFSIKGDAWKTCDIHSEFELLRNKGEVDASKTTVKQAISWMTTKDYLKKLRKGEYARNWEGEFSL